MIVTLDDKTIEAKIMKKEAAQQKYDDGYAQGKMVTMLKESDDFDLH